MTSGARSVRGMPSGVSNESPPSSSRRARDYDDQRMELEDALRTFMLEEANRPDVIVLANCDFGHTDPQWVLPFSAARAKAPTRA